MKRSTRVALLSTAALLSGLVMTGLPAQGRTAGIKVIATGLDNPRGVEVGPSGGVYVAEAGRAGRHCKGVGPNAMCYGFTGAVTRIRKGHQHKVVRGLISAGGKDGSFTVGVDDIAVSPRKVLYGIMTSANKDSSRCCGVRGRHQLGNLLRFKSGKKQKVADIDNYEFAHDPDNGGIDSDPYGVAIGKGKKLVVDAAGNDLFSVGPKGHLKLVAVFHSRKFNGHVVQSVPTSVAIGPDGSYYVGELGGEGLPNGKARVWRIKPGQKPKVFATGFNTIIGVDVGSDGRVYVAEILKNGFPQLQTGDFTGALFRLGAHGSTRTELAKGKLRAPGGVAVSADNTKIYVSTYSVAPGRGKVVRITNP